MTSIAQNGGGAALFSVFDRIYVINLAYRTDRRREMEEQLNRIGLSFDHPGVELFEAVRPDEAGEFPSIGCRGCFMSHLGVLQDAVEAGHQSILVLEDDTNFRADFSRRMPAIADRLKSDDWDMFYGWSAATIGQPPIADNTEVVAIAPDVALTTAHFIGYRRRAFAAMVPYLSAIAARPMGDPAGGPMHVDGAMAWFRAAHPQLRTLGALYPLARQRPSRTDIQDVRWFDRVAILAPLVRLYRAIKSRLRRE